MSLGIIKLYSSGSIAEISSNTDIYAISMVENGPKNTRNKTWLQADIFQS